MNPFERIIRAFKAKAAKKDFDFSAFVSSIPLTRKQLLIEECKKRDVSIFVDDSSEQSAGVYANLRAVASEAELESRLNAKKEIILSKRANVISILALIKSFI